MEDYLAKLNPQQRDAVVHTTTPQLVIAGAGSGKTRVITYKIVHLLAGGMRPFRILALTFTNKAAKEMKMRISDVMGEATANRLWMGTFHSMFLRILHTHYDKIGYSSGFTIYDASDSKALVRTIIKDMGLDEKLYRPQDVQSRISMAKNSLLSPDDYAADRDLMEIDRRAKKPMVHAIYRAYSRRCQIANAMDFDDILYYTYRLFQENPEVRNHYREFFQYVLVDEYQDTNAAQARIIQQLTVGQNNLMVVGDDSQSIYSFRGANIMNILGMEKVYPNLTVHKLERNYRSTFTITEAANSIIRKNQRQIPKEVFTENEKGDLIKILECHSDYEESYTVATDINTSIHRFHDNYSDYAILYRTNAQSRVFEEALRKRNIPYRIYGGLSFYQRKEVKDAVAYFRLVCNPDDDEALRRIINYPARGIGDTTLNKITSLAIEKDRSMWQVISTDTIDALNINSGTKKKLLTFVELIEGLIKRNAASADAYDMASEIIKRTGLLSILLTDRTPESISKQENLNELLNAASSFVSQRREEGNETEVSLSDFMNEVSLTTDLDGHGEGDNKDTVTLMTVHSAKGLEFKHVYIVGLEKDLFPSALSMGSPEEYEEERRLMYVALTRAMKTCTISYARERYRNGQPVRCVVSPFVGEIDPKYLEDGFATSSIRSVDSQVSFAPSGRHLWGSKMNVNGTGERKKWPDGLRNSFENRSLSRPFKKESAASYNNSDSEYRVHTLSELQTGMNIEHSRFGRGTIVEKEKNEFGDRIVVNFNQFDQKTLLLKFARFKLID